MTVREVVRAAHDAMRERWYDTTSEEKARLAVAAVLRALPKSDKAVTAGGYALMQSEGADHPDLDFSLALRKDEARTVLAALAQLADDE